ncbi:hypothetical protein F5Y09DRAFT_301193 [Xylaria sp. FL1042]|nr:hypothetical protein F5Y09DRAFT_301193 [Xylaria sp. FL1042]
MPSTRLVSRIAYNTVYGFLCLVLTLLLLIVPGDFIQQALTNTHQIINLIVIAIVYVITFLIVLFVYFLRLYVTRTVLASIPKPWMPIEKGDVKKEVHGMILKSHAQSATIAWEARPRVLTPPNAPIALETAARGGGEGGREGVAGDENTDNAQPRESSPSGQLSRSENPTAVENETAMDTSLPPLRPIWGDIEHYGWASPASPDLPNLQYATVLAELPNLIEAKAVAQAPPDLGSVPTAPLFDAEAVMLLQRASDMTLRGYIAHLTSLGVLRGSRDVVRFLDLYERVRFSGRCMSNATFRSLMHLFAGLLRAMRPLNPRVLYGDDNSSLGFDGHIDDDAPQDSNPTTRTPTPSLKSIRSNLSFNRNPNSTRVSRLGAQNSSAATQSQYRTAPTTPRSRAGGTFASRSPSSASSASSFTQSRRPYPASEASSVSLGSGSVIRLATTSDTGSLPYVLRLTDTI